MVVVEIYNTFLVNLSSSEKRICHGKSDALPVLSGCGTGVAADYVEYARQFSDLH